MGTRKAFTTGLSAGLATAPSANPFLIGGATIGGAVVGALQDDNPFKFDPNPFRENFKKMARTTRRRARRSGQEAANTSRARTASRGLGGELSESIASGSERAVRQQADEWLSDRENELEQNIAHAEAWTDAANRADAQKDWSSLGRSIVATGSNLATTDSPLRDALGIGAPKATPEDKGTSEGDQGKTPGSQFDKRYMRGTNTAKVDGDQGETPVSQFDERNMRGTDTFASSGLTANSTKEQISEHIAKHEIREGSRLGKLYHMNPTQMGLLEQAFGAQWLKDAFSLY